VIDSQSNLLQHTDKIKTIERTAFFKVVSGGFAIKKATKAFCSGNGEKTFLAFFIAHAKV